MNFIAYIRRRGIAGLREYMLKYLMGHIVLQNGCANFHPTNSVSNFKGKS